MGTLDDKNQGIVTSLGVIHSELPEINIDHAKSQRAVLTAQVAKSPEGAVSWR